MKRLTFGVLTVLLFVVTACGGETPTSTPVAPVVPTNAPAGTTPAPQGATPAPVSGPERVTIQHIMIAFEGTGTAATRTQDEAKKLATDVLAQVQGGGDFDALMKQYSDDPGPGIYTLANTGVTASATAGEIPREQMPPAFGNVSFGLQVGEIGFAEYEPQASPVGWHIIKRLAGPPPTPTALPTIPASTGPIPKYMVVETAKGTFTIQLYGDPADGVQNVARNFADKARAGYFDGKTFHRVEDWVVQGGDPLGNGTGGGDIPSQYNQKPFLRGAVGVASTAGGGPQINDSQWFVVKSDAMHLNGQYANFGQVVAGIAVVDQLAKGDVMTKVTVTDEAGFTPDPTRGPPTPAPTAAPASGPAHLSVQHILISFAGTGTKATRTQEEAKTLAADVFAQAKGGADFDKLVAQYTDDQAPGIYNMSNIGVTADQAQQEYPRDGMVPAFGNVAFDLEVGEIGMAEYDATTSPFGWHIIKRLK